MDPLLAFFIKVMEAVFIILLRDGAIKLLKGFKKQSKRTSLTPQKRKKGGSKSK